MDRLIRLEPSLVVIRVEQGQKCSGELTLRNVMHTMPVAYKLQPMNQKRFTIRPQLGIIAPLSTTKVEIIYLYTPHTNIHESSIDCAEWFQLQSVVALSAMVKSINPFSNTNDLVAIECFNNKNKQLFVDYGLKVLLIGPQILARLIFNGSVREIREQLEKSKPYWKLVDCVNENGQTLLHLAIAQSRDDIVQLLLEFGPNVEARSRSGVSPLESAAAAGEALIVELLLAHKACPDQAEASVAGPIHYASWAGHSEILRMILLKGAKIDAVTQNGETALHLAVEKQKRDCVRLLLASGAQTNVQNNSYGETPLHIASGLGNEQMVKLLIQKGAKKDVRNRYGKTAYYIAAKKGFTKLFDALRLRDSLCLAARKGVARAIRRLIEDGASTNGLDQNGWTALHRASFKGKIEAVKALVEKGIHVNAKDEEGYTALQCAVEAGHADVAGYLLKVGADLEGKTNKGVTALQISQSLGYLGMTNILQHGHKNDMFDSEISFCNKLKGKEVVFGAKVKARSGGDCCKLWC